MAASDPWKRYLDAGMELTQITRQRAEKLVRDLVKAGEVQRHEAQQWVEDLVERSRRTTDNLGEVVRNEVTRQMQALGLVERPTTEAAEKTATKAASTAKKATKKAASGTKKTASKAASTTKKAAGGS